MADNKINSTVESLFKGMNEFIASKTVVGEPVRVGDTTIIPLVEVSFGMAAGASGEAAKQKGNGGMGGKMIPNSVLVIKDVNVKLVNIKNQDSITKLLDMVPDVLDRFKPKDKDVEEAVEKSVEDIKANPEL